MYDAEEFLCDGQSFFSVWDSEDHHFQECASFVLPVATWLFFLLLLWFARICFGKQIRAERRIVVLPRIRHAVLWLLHLIILFASFADLLYGLVQPPDSNAGKHPHMRIEKIYFWSLPFVWTMSFEAVFVRRRALEVSTCFLFWLLNATASMPLCYNLTLGSVDMMGGTGARLETMAAAFVVALVGTSHALSWALRQTPVRCAAKPECPMQGAGPLNKVFFNWCWPLVQLGAQRPLQLTDVWECMHVDSVGVNSALFQRYCQREKKDARGRDKASGVEERESTQHSSLIRAMLVLYWRPFVLCGIMQSTSAILDFLGPVMLSRFVDLAAEPADSGSGGVRAVAVGYVLVLTLGRGLSAVLQQHTQFETARLGLRVSGALKAALYIKVLRLSAEERQERSAGDMVNLLTVDVQRVTAAATGLWSALVLPAQMVLAMVLLWRAIGASMLAGLAGMVVILSANYVIAGYQKSVSEQVMDQKDERMKATTEMLNAMRQIKLEALELRFRDKILALRSVELALLWRQLLLGALNIFLLWMAPLLISVASFAAFTLLANEQMTPSRVFTALALFRLLQEPLRSLPGFVMQLIQAAVSLERLSLFLAARELQVVREREAMGLSEVCEGIVCEPLAHLSTDSSQTDSALAARAPASRAAPKGRGVGRGVGSKGRVGVEKWRGKRETPSRDEIDVADKDEGGLQGRVVLSNVELSWLDYCLHQSTKEACRQCRALERKTEESKEKHAGKARDADARAAEEGAAHTERRNRAKTRRNHDNRDTSSNPTEAAVRAARVQGREGRAEQREGRRGHSGNLWEEEEKEGKGDDQGCVQVAGRVVLEPGSLHLVIGRVGSGKSTLLQAVAGQLNYRPLSVARDGATEARRGVSVKRPGKPFAAGRGKADASSELQVSGDVALCTQSPWILHASIRDNVVGFRHEEEEEKEEEKEGGEGGCNDVKGNVRGRGAGGACGLYTRVVQACQLEDDLLQLPAGDATEIGERGINLSGGQKWRVALARAAYSTAPILALDDPLSALDARVAERVFDEYIVQLLHGRTRLIATNQLEHALSPQVASLLVLHTCQVLTCPPYMLCPPYMVLTCPPYMLLVLHTRQDTVAGTRDRRSGKFVTQIPALAGGGSCREMVEALRQVGVALPELAVQQAQHAEMAAATAAAAAAASCLQASEATGVNPQELKRDEENFEMPAAPPEGMDGLQLPGLRSEGGRVAEDKCNNRVAGALVKEEERETGKVSAAVYAKYLHAVGGWPVALALLAIQTCWQGLQVASDLFLSSWTSESEAEQAAAGAQERSLGVYALLCLGAALMVLARTLIVSSTGLRGARALFLWQTEAVVRAPMRFFNTTPIGRILNRATEDQNAVDTQLCFAFGSLLAQAFSMIGQVLTTAVITRYMLIPIAPMLFVYWRVTALYLESSRELQRIVSISKSPVLSHVSASATGAATIRAFGSATRAAFVARFVLLLDEQQAAAFAAMAATQWFSLRLRLVGVLVLFCTTGALALLHGAIPAGLVGLAISYGLVVEDIISSLVFYWQWVENSMVSPERILHYADLDSEAPLDDSRTSDSEALRQRFEAPTLSYSNSPHCAGSSNIQAPPPAWPEQGVVDFDNVEMAYSASAEPVLRQLSFRAGAGEMVGIVGRTGAGKSSIAAALFRLVELRAGVIRIDGIDIASVGLHTLRKRMSIVSQDPVLFAGPLRSYLDPFGEHADEEVWQALEQVKLKAMFASKAKGLEHPLSDDGANLSQGQRQLVCLARVLLLQARVVVMDEATAAMDDDTDLVVQRTVRESFRDSTLLVIAHRIKTIIDCNQVNPKP
jgi:ABC-type multidrug transport system fused ATPase/permease subunit